MEFNLQNDPLKRNYPLASKTELLHKIEQHLKWKEGFEKQKIEERDKLLYQWKKLEANGMYYGNSQVFAVLEYIEEKLLGGDADRFIKKKEITAEEVGGDKDNQVSLQER